jgi:hypothetical protein
MRVICTEIHRLLIRLLLARVLLEPLAEKRGGVGGVPRMKKRRSGRIKIHEGKFYEYKVENDLRKNGCKFSHSGTRNSVVFDLQHAETFWQSNFQ